MTRFPLNLDEVLPAGLTVPDSAIEDLAAYKEKLGFLKRAEDALTQQDADFATLDPAMVPPEDVTKLASMIGERNRLWWLSVTITARVAQDLMNFVDHAKKPGGWFAVMYDGADAKVKAARADLARRYPPTGPNQDRSHIERGDVRLREACNASVELANFRDHLDGVRDKARVVYGKAREAFAAHLRAKLEDPTPLAQSHDGPPAFVTLNYPINAA